MQSTYKKEISKKDKWWIGAVILFAAIVFVLSFLTDGFHTWFWKMYGPLLLVQQYFLYKLPATKINRETNRLAVGSGYINIPQIISLEEREKKGMRVRYLFNDMERISLIPPVCDADKPRLFADLLQINPNIAIMPTS